MTIFKRLLDGSGGVIGKVTSIVDKAVIDKDKRNQMIYEISLLMMQSRIAPYVRAILGITIVVSILFFGDKITLDPEGQKYALYSVLGYYFLDRVFDSFKSRK
jgi:hypothetical protein